jgi:hypothetical protein
VHRATRVARCTFPAAAHAQGTGYFVTIAARTRSAYTDITANKLRNNIQESLRDPGPGHAVPDG